MNKKSNGHDPDHNKQDHEKIVHFPSANERHKLKADEEKRLRKQYRKEQKARKKATSEPFLNLGRIPPFTKIWLSMVLLVNIPLLVGNWFPGGSGLHLWVMYHFGFIPGVFTGTFDWFWTAPLTPLSHIFIHGGWMHLFFNIAMGAALSLHFENTYGTRAAIKFFFTCCIGGLLIYTAFAPFAITPLVGASAGISGLFGAILLGILDQLRNMPQHYSTASIIGGQHAIQQRAAQFMKRKGPWPIIIFWGIFMTLIGMLSGDNVAWTAHLGGYASGIIILMLYRKGKIQL